MPRILVIRLSSLGDVVLATAALEGSDSSERFEWLVSREYAELLHGHPKIDKVWEFDRRQGFVAWWKFCAKLQNEKYDVVLDLHASLRTQLARLCFTFYKLRGLHVPATWETISKQRIRLYGYFILKGLWPEAWRPKPWVQRYSEMLGKGANGKPNLSHLKKSGTPGQIADPYLCVMPSSLWNGKKWGLAYFVDVIQKSGLFPVILGTKEDPESAELVAQLTEKKIPHLSGVSVWGLAEVANVLGHAVAYLGNDTGLSHLAEAVGTPAWVIFGPTTPAMGFGPWRKTSRSFGSSLWCRPCGKDGRHCFRVGNRFMCMSHFTAESVVDLLPELKTDSRLKL